eukprot:scaffold2797_cov129-Ochromonas_danica.AAC.1
MASDRPSLQSFISFSLPCLEEARFPKKRRNRFGSGNTKNLLRGEKTLSPKDCETAGPQTGTPLLAAVALLRSVLTVKFVRASHSIMTKTLPVLTLLLLGIAGLINAECPNACSAHGKCGAYDMCTCFRNWMANDCSERICQFGLAHVDSPKGDLDASSGALSNASEIVVVNDFIYRFGTTELYPATTDIAGNVLTNTAHEYRECSNKGLCDRSTGTCSCFEGYEGSACQRASCPSGPNGVCSGHGTCETISEIAAQDFDNIY